MSDDSTHERNTFRAVFPEAFLLLCIFHVLQAMWRYIWDSKHEVNFEDKPHVYFLFREILYASSVEEFEMLYEKALSDPILSSYKLVNDHIEDLKKRAKEWALCFRLELLTRGHQTNNFCEAIMRLIKGLILGRLKAYNTVQLFHILCEDMDSHFKTKLAFVVHNRVKSLRSRLRVKPEKLKPLVAESLFSSKDLYKVKNVSKNTEYTVDMALEICSCKGGMCGAPCKHQLAVAKKFKITHQQFLPTNDPEFKMNLFYFMTGQTTAPDGLFDTLKGGEVVVQPIELDSNSPSQGEGNAIDQNEDYEPPEILEGLANNNNLSQSSLEEKRERIMNMAEDLFQKLSSSPDYMAEPVDKFLNAYFTIANRANYESTLASALATFSKDQSVLKPVFGRSSRINVQPTALGRRVHTDDGGKQAQPGGRPRNSVKKTHHDYNKQVKRRAEPMPYQPGLIPRRRKQRSPIP
ncbi:Rab5 GDP/GTP exchange factor [Frankliniella fusca]|uniref:Rab5 GDP/GTP exchange factor n=1 Tax=Frankliniella fusca TaxID=407009 RepID=A0AAE1HNW3_9NEOP|nr:Rab5 GDP/GTP exchange factor [Frankliniella fusca]